MEDEFIDDESYNQDSEYDDDEPEMTWEERVQDFIEEMEDIGVDVYSWK